MVTSGGHHPAARPPRAVGLIMRTPAIWTAAAQTSPSPTRAAAHRLVQALTPVQRGMLADNLRKLLESLGDTQTHSPHVWAPNGQRAPAVGHPAHRTTHP